MIELNNRGLIIPDYNIPASILEFESVFVTSLQSPHRKALFEEYLDYMVRLYAILGNFSFVQWIDGSFTTTVAKPNDIDIVTFINFDEVNRLSGQLTEFKYPASLRYGMDAYIVQVYPPDHRLFALYLGDKAYWMDKFSKTERNRRGIVHRKGFLELTHSDEERATLKSLRSDSRDSGDRQPA